MVQVTCSQSLIIPLCQKNGFYLSLNVLSESHGARHFSLYHVNQIAPVLISATNEMFSMSIVDHCAIGNSIFANTKVGHVLHHEYCKTLQ